MAKQFYLLSIFLVTLAWLPRSFALIQKWEFRREDRHQFLIERFGFDAGGSIELRFLLIDPTTQPPSDKAAILIRHEEEVASFKELFQEPFASHTCLLDNETSTEMINFYSNSTWNISRTIDNNRLKPGFYYLYFARCSQDEMPPLTFYMTAELRNPGPNYLPAGDASLPSVFYGFSACFFAALIAWVIILRKNREQVHHIHHMMAVLLLFKFLSISAEGMRYQYMKANGDALTNWNIAFYVFAFIKGIMLFVVILLIGTGWSLLKPSLNDKEKKIILVVLTLQVLNNIAFVASEEAAVGTQAWISWRDVLHLVDIICCCAILFPIVWSIRSLRMASSTDGKAHINLQKLTQFRSFYLVVVCYIYFTRIAVYLLASSLPYHLTWLKEFFSQGASLMFYVTTGWKFMPAATNPYTAVYQRDEDALDEFGLDEDDGMEMTQTSSSRSDVRIAL